MARLVPGLGLEQQPQNAHHTEDDAETRIEIGLESRWENGIHDGPKRAHTANSGQLALSEGSTRTWPLQKLRARQRGQFHCLFSLGRRRIRAIVFVKSPRFHGLKNSYSKRHSLGAIRPRPSRLDGSTRAERRRAEQRVRNGMTDGIAVGVTGAMPVGRDVDAAQSHRSALAEPVRVVADTNAQRQRRAHAATVACACAPPLMSE